MVRVAASAAAAARWPFRPKDSDRADSHWECGRRGRVRLCGIAHILWMLTLGMRVGANT
jgi:hypothetical protein